jgi:hypothetical protein
MAKTRRAAEAARRTAEAARRLRLEDAYYGSARWERLYRDACLRWGLCEPWMLPDMGDVCALVGVMKDTGALSVLPPAPLAGFDFSEQEMCFAMRAAFVRRRMPPDVEIPPPTKVTTAEFKATVSYWETFYAML